MRLQPLLIAVVTSSSLATGPMAFADTTALLEVLGTITPTACDLTLSSNEVNLGAHNMHNLQVNTVTPLLEQTITLGVTCEAAAGFALKAVDGVPGSAYDSSGDSFGLGFGSDGVEKIGYYHLRFDASSLLGDSVPVIGLSSGDKRTWTTASITPPGGNGGNGPTIAHGGTYLAFGDASAPSRVKDITEFSGSLEVRAFIAPRSGLTVGDALDLNGSATIEIDYL